MYDRKVHFSGSGIPDKEDFLSTGETLTFQSKQFVDRKTESDI